MWYFLNIEKTLLLFLYLCLVRKLTLISCFLFSSARVEPFIIVTVSTHGIFILKHNLTAGWRPYVCAVDLTQLVSARFIFPLSTGVWSVLSSAQPKPHGAPTNLSGPSVFRAAWGTPAGSVNELALLPLWPPPVIVWSPYATCLSHIGLLMSAGCGDASPHCHVVHHNVLIILIQLLHQSFTAYSTIFLPSW